MQRQNLTVYEYILDVNLLNLANYKLNIFEKKGNVPFFYRFHFIASGLFTFVNYPEWESSLEIELCSDWWAILEKIKSLIFAR